MLDLCSGLGGASAAMKKRAWDVVTTDINPDFKPDIVADIQDWSWTGPRPHLIWASPPCTQFSRESMPWSRTGQPPDMSLINACKRIINECAPLYWIIENVKGAVPHLGQPSAIYGPFYLWGFFPPLGQFQLEHRKQSFPGYAKAERAKIPYRLSLAVALACERQPAHLPICPFEVLRM
jgi:hypothetical protein